jgi:elongation factor Ts
MPNFTAKDVQALRQATGAGMMDAKRALDDNDGDMDAAGQWLREKGLASMAKRDDRENSQGAVAVATTDEAISLVELRCETDFVAKSDDFVGLVEELSRLVASKGEDAVNERQDEIDRLRVTLKENIQLGRVVRFQGGPETVSDAYLHIQSGRGVNGVLVEMEGGDVELAHGIALHIAFAKPRFLNRDEVPADAVEEERKALEAISRNEGKPEAALPKIIEGRLTGWFKERCLLDQGYVQDEKQSVQQVLDAAGAKINRFAQVVIGQ